MIEPTYRRDQLWRPMRRRTDLAIVVGMCVGLSVSVAAVAARPHSTPFIDASPRSKAQLLVAKLVHDQFPEWRAHHTGCPHRLAELGVPYPLDPWSHALHYTCDRRIAPGRVFTVTSAGPDGVFGTADDLEAHE